MRSFYGNTYNQDYLDYVFVEENGKLIYPSVVTSNFSKILKKNNLKHIRFHDLRHSCASIMLANGVQMKQIQDWLGHANFQTTADVYSHLDFSSKVQSANVIANALDVEKKSENEKADLQKMDKHLFKNMIKEMLRLGFDDVDEYLSYAENKSENKSKKDFYM